MNAIAERPKEIVVEVLFDTVCPWCFVGKRRLDAAIAERSHLPVRLVWHPFYLNPDIARTGMDRAAYMNAKFGTARRIDRVEGMIAAAGRESGITFAWNRINRIPHTALSHRLISFATQAGLQNEAVDAVFTAYFSDGIDIADPDALIAIAEGLHLPPDQARVALASDDDEAIRQETLRAHRRGITAVPCLVFQDRYCLSGANEAAVVVRMLDLAAQTLQVEEILADS